MPDGNNIANPAPDPAGAIVQGAAADPPPPTAPPPAYISAQQRQIALHDKTNQWLAYGVTAGFFLLIVLLFFFPGSGANDGARNLLFTLLGVVGTGWATIISYYFGSSMGSNQKSQTIDAILNK